MIFNAIQRLLPLLTNLLNAHLGNLVHTRSDEQETNTGSEHSLHSSYAHSLHSSYAHYERESVIAQYSVIDEEPQPYEYSCPSAPKWVGIQNALLVVPWTKVFIFLDGSRRVLLL